MSNSVLLNNRYRLDSRLGSGGMADIYHAQDILLERTVAIKILKHDFSTNRAFRDRFHQEAKAAANLSHPNIVTVHDFGLAHGSHPFIVMEFIPGNDLKHSLERRGRFTVQETIPLMIQACAGLGYAHRAGLVHCDIKPQNLLISPDQRLKITDFGISRTLSSIRQGERTNIVWGSPVYFSPEQAAGYAPLPASDVYSLGVILYEMLTGRLPFLGKTAEELSQAHLTTNPIPPRKINPEIPAILEEIILKVLAKEPSSRYRTADQLGYILLSVEKTLSQSSINRQDVTELDLDGLFPDENLTEWNGVTLRKDKPIAQKRGFIENKFRGLNEQDLAIDWITIGLFFFALLTVGGLVPFWIWVYFR